MIVLPYEPDHLRSLLLQRSQSMMQPMLMDVSYAESLKLGGPAFSAVVDNEIIASLGIIPQWQNRAVAWGLIGENAAQHFIPLHRAVRRFLELSDYRRIETSVATNFKEGHRWAQLLGFKNEGTMKAFTPNGDDCDLYAKVR